MCFLNGYAFGDRIPMIVNKNILNAHEMNEWYTVFQNAAVILILN